jgi:hypothetical protein
MVRLRARVIVVLTLVMSAAALARPELVPIGDRHVSVNCNGTAGGSATVVLMAGGNRTATDWAKVQPAVAGFARVCSYDRAGLGEAIDRHDRSPSMKLPAIRDVIHTR